MTQAVDRLADRLGGSVPSQAMKEDDEQKECSIRYADTDYSRLFNEMAYFISLLTIF